MEQQQTRVPGTCTPAISVLL